MWLRTASGKELLLAKYDGVEWNVFHDKLTEKLQALLDDDFADGNCNNEPKKDGFVPFKLEFDHIKD